MLIDLHKLPDEAEITQVYEPEWWRAGEESEQVLGLDAPLHVKLRIHRVGKKYVLDGRMEGGGHGKV